MKEILFENVYKSYGNTQVVKNLNLRIEAGERLILLGPSGCGKSTTLRMIAGLEKITSGNLYMGGELMNNVDSGKRNVAMVFQNYALFPHMTVYDNISYGLRVHKLPKNQIEDRLRQVIEMLDLTGLEKRKPKELSGGQRQRVALARAIVKRSDYFLLDEPLSNLDAQLRVHARKELVKIHEIYNQTFVYVTHDQVEAMTMGNRVALIYKGELQMCDTPSNVYNRPSNVFVAKFIGSPSTNICDAYYEEGSLCIGQQKIPLPEIWCEQVVKSASKKLLFGIRPEHIKLSKRKTSGALSGTVKYIEDYGSKAGIYFEIDGIEFVAVCETGAPHVGDTVYFMPDFSRVHLFDRQSSQSIGYPEKI